MSNEFTCDVVLRVNVETPEDAAATIAAALAIARTIGAPIAPECLIAVRKPETPAPPPVDAARTLFDGIMASPDA